jgi:hypothetical protein
VIKYIYYRFLYARIMRFAHKHGWHKMRICYPDGDTMHICDWCGLRVVTKRAEKPDLKYPISIKGPQQAT